LEELVVREFEDVIWLLISTLEARINLYLDKHVSQVVWFNNYSALPVQITCLTLFIGVAWKYMYRIANNIQLQRADAVQPI
jgi:hypothetical protein